MEKLVLCVYGVIMHLGNVRRILEKRVKHSATSRVYTLLSYSPNISRVHYHTINARDSFSDSSVTCLTE